MRDGLAWAIATFTPVAIFLPFYFVCGVPLTWWVILSMVGLAVLLMAILYDPYKD